MKTGRGWSGFLAAAATIVAIGCNSEPPKTETAAAPPPAPKPKTVAEQVAFYRECWNDFNVKAWDKFGQCYTTDAVSEQLGAGMPAMTGQQAVVDYAKTFATAFPDGEGTLQLILAKDGTTIALAQMNGTQKGPLPGPDGKPIAATNKPIGFVMGHVIVWDALREKAVREEAYQDSATMMAQLGLSTAPARPVAAKPASASPTVVMSTGSETETKNLELFKAQLEAFNKHDVKAVEAFNASDALYHDYTSPKDLTGKENAAVLTSFIKAFPDCKLVVTSSWAAGDYVVFSGTFEGNNTGTAPAMGIKKATNKAVKVPFIEVTKYDGGKIKEDWLVYESMAFASQLGLM